MKRLVQLDATAADPNPPPWRCEQCLRVARIGGQGALMHEVDGTPICEFTYTAAPDEFFYRTIAP